MTSDMRDIVLYKYSNTNIIVGLILFIMIAVLLLFPPVSTKHIIGVILLLLIIYRILAGKFKTISINSTTLKIDYKFLPYLSKSFNLGDIKRIELCSPVTPKGGYFLWVRMNDETHSKFHIVMNPTDLETFDQMEMAFTAKGIKVERIN